MDSDPDEIIAIYRQRWETKLLFKQMKQNFPLKYFYGESANAIKIRIWVTLIVNLLLIIMQKGLKQQWRFSELATMVKITMMYYVDFYSLFNNPKKTGKACYWRHPPHRLNLRCLTEGGGGLGKHKNRIDYRRINDRAICFLLFQVLSDSNNFF